MNHYDSPHSALCKLMDDLDNFQSNGRNMILNSLSIEYKYTVIVT